MKESPKFSQIYYNSIRDEIIQMGLKDQKMRQMSHDDEKYFDPELDRKNFIRMEQIIGELEAWPTISEIGKLASELAWLLVQHADHNINFQKYCLALMKELAASDPKEIDQTKIAYLEDRIMIKETGEQLYGTQLVRRPDGNYELSPIKDRDQVNERRMLLGLEPVENYVEKFNLNLKKI